MRPRRSRGQDTLEARRSSRRMMRSCARSGMNRDRKMPITSAIATTTAQPVMKLGVANESHRDDDDVDEQNRQREEVKHRYESPMAGAGLRLCGHCARLRLICPKFASSRIAKTSQSPLNSWLRGLCFGFARVALESRDHGVQPGLARGKADALHQNANEILEECRASSRAAAHSPPRR